MHNGCDRAVGFFIRHLQAAFCIVIAIVVLILLKWVERN